jgi:hypothetical protein
MPVEKVAEVKVASSNRQPIEFSLQKTCSSVSLIGSEAAFGFRRCQSSGVIVDSQRLLSASSSCYCNFLYSVWSDSERSHHRPSCGILPCVSPFVCPLWQRDAIEVSAGIHTSVGINGWAQG